MANIILASQSPRRKELLAQMGVSFQAVASGFSERLDDNQSPGAVAVELALGKALAVSAQYPDALVIGSDTIVVFKGRQLGKQPDKASTRQLLQALSGQTVEVITAVALVCSASSLEEARTESAGITFAAYDDATIDTYLGTSEWQDKAGAVSIQSASSPPVANLSGHYDTVLGLATRPLAALLSEQGVRAKPVSITYTRARSNAAGHVC